MDTVFLAVDIDPGRLPCAEGNPVVHGIDLPMAEFIVGLDPFLESPSLHINHPQPPTIHLSAAQTEKNLLPVGRKREAFAEPIDVPFRLEVFRIGAYERLFQSGGKITSAHPFVIKPVQLARRSIKKTRLHIRKFGERPLFDINHHKTFFFGLRRVRRREKEEPPVIRNGLVCEVQTLLAEGMHLGLQNV